MNGKKRGNTKIGRTKKERKKERIAKERKLTTKSKQAEEDNI